MTMQHAGETTGRVSLGAIVQVNGVLFRTWATKATRVHLLLDTHSNPIPMQATGDGYFEVFVPECTAGRCYHFQLDDGGLLPDPASRFQPAGVHGPSQVVDIGGYPWRDQSWQGVEQKDLVIYELHVGTFSPQGNYAGVQERLHYLKQLGITAIELMPIAEFAGRWNWGYDSVALYAPFHGYGEPDELCRLIDAAHEAGIAVILDVVYNHFGPDGCYATSFAKFFSDHHHSPWGQGVNLDDVHSDGVRNFFIENAIYWLRDYHLDGLRLDATHALLDDSPIHFLDELSQAVELLDGPKRCLIAEDSRNLADLVRPRSVGGFALDGIWSDDFHHQIRNLTAGDSEGYFGSFANSTAYQVAQTLKQGWYFAGQVACESEEPRGTSTAGVPLDRFVICIQNHDQVGNRPTGARINHEISFSMYRAISALLLFAPETPLLFMGQEWAATTPFRFFTDHNEELGYLITAGRKKEFQGFSGFLGEVPDPQAPETFQHSKLNWEELEKPLHRHISQLYRDLLAVRRSVEGPLDIEVHGDRAMTISRGRHQLILSLAEEVDLPIADKFKALIVTEEPRYAADGHMPKQTGTTIHFPVPAAVIGLVT